MEEPESGKSVRDESSCPHCGHTLSQWEQVLLSVDRALMCKNCWYRITLKAYEDRQGQAPSEGTSPEPTPKDTR